MRFLPRKLLTAGLLAIYGGIAVLGYGLHEFAPAHHHGAVAEFVCHGDCGGHAHQHLATSGKSLTSSHECEICVFLDQLRSERPMLTAEVVWQHHVAAVYAATPRIIFQATPGLHVPRGPPILIG